MSLRLAMYCRKSTTDSEDRQIQSIPDQKRELGYEVERKSLNIVEYFDESKSAKKPGRVGFNEMIEKLERGELDGIICWKLNRLSRNPIDGGKIQWLLQRGIIKTIITPGKEYLPTDNVLMMAVELGMANQFIIDLSKDVTRGMRTKVEKGWRPGRAPLGYLNDKATDKGKKILHVDHARFSLVRKMWNMLLTGNYSVMRVLWTATEEWGLRTRENKKLGLSSLYRIFVNPFYYGEFLYKDGLHPGKHTPMITREEYDQAQTILGSKGRPRPKSKRLPFNGIIKCGECDGTVVAEEKFKLNKSKNERKRYLYHHCSHNKRNKECHQPSLTHEELNRQIKTYFEQITIPEVFLHWAVEILQKNNEVEEYDRTIILKNQQENFNGCIKRIDNLIKIYVSTENIKRELLSDEEFKQQKNILMAEKARIENEIRKIETRVDDWMELTEKTFEFATYAKHWFDEGDFEKKTQILQTLGQNFCLTDKKLTIELKKPFLVLKTGLENELLKKARLEPSVYCEDKRKNSLSQTVFSTLSR